jgi:hypothetical protein
MDPKTLTKDAVLRVLMVARTGDSIRVRFKPGTGKKGTLSDAERTALASFVALAGIADPKGNFKLFRWSTTSLGEMMAAAEMLAVSMSGFWDQVSKTRTLVLRRSTHGEEADFYPDRILPVLDEFTLVVDPANAIG